MANLNSENIGLNYKGILNLDSTINTPLDATLRAVTDGEGNASPLQLSTTAVSLGGATGANWDNTNNRLGIGTNAPTFNLEVKKSSNQLKLSSSADIYTYLETSASGGLVSMKFGNGSGTTHFINNYSTGVWASNKWAFGSNYFVPSAQLHIKGSGTTSSTTSLLVQNSAGNTSLQITDDQTLTGFSASQLRFRLGTTTAGQGVSTKDGQFSIGSIDASQLSAIRFLVLNSGSGYIDSFSDGVSKFLNYPLFIGSRANNAGISITGATTQENGTPTFFGSAVSYPSAIVGINSTTRGFLPPRMTAAQIIAIVAPADGLVAFNTDIQTLCFYGSGAWQKISHAVM